MISLPQPAESDQEVLDGLPIVRLSEDADVLKCLLTMLYLPLYLTPTTKL